MVFKSLILAAGRGKRMGKLCDENNKCLLELGGSPLIEYSLECSVKINSSEILIVVGYQAEKIMERYGSNYKGIPIKYIFQPEQMGLVHAIERAREALENEDFMLMLGDELMINPKHQEMIKKYYKENIFCLCGVVYVENEDLIKKTYAVLENKNNIIYRVIEKPIRPINNIMGTGNCILKNEILNYIGKTPINPKRGEKELVDMIQCAIDDGHKVKSFSVCDTYFNVNSPTEIDETNSYFLHP